MLSKALMQRTRVGAVQTARRNFGAVVKADGSHKFIQPVDKKFIAFEGLKGTSTANVALDNSYRHHNNLPLLQ